MAYGPTSLDYINLPNPVEPTQPQTGSQTHPLNSIARLDQDRPDNASDKELFKLIHETGGERPTKKQKYLDNTSLDLPRLPVRSTAKRLRIPPTLSGLHQPPPDAGLLPSINIEQPQVPPPRQQDVLLSESLINAPKSQGIAQLQTRQTLGATKVIPTNGVPQDNSNFRKKQTKRNKWTETETAHLLKGVAKFGIGNWTKILNSSDYDFETRSALDLKDRFRICCPYHYKAAKHATGLPASGSTTLGHESQLLAKTRPGIKPVRSASEEVSQSKLLELGIDQPFSKSARRSRRGYTPVEDDALLKGYQTYGNSWALIRQDKTFHLSHRTPTDLRDRFRTRYPEEYAKAGLVLRLDKPVTAVKRTRDDETANSSNTPFDEMAVSSELATPLIPSIVPALPTKDDTVTTKSVKAKKPNQPPLFSLDDVFLGVPFGTDDLDSEPIVLDRGILDWATTGATRNAQPDVSKNHGIDPRVTLKLPKPIPNARASSAAVSAQPRLANIIPALPSLASLLAGDLNCRTV